MKVSNNTELLLAMQEIVSREPWVAAPAQQKDPPHHLTIISKVVGEYLGFNPEERRQLDSALGLLFPENKIQDIPHHEIAVRALTLSTYLRTSVSHEVLANGLSFQGRMTPEFKKRKEEEWLHIPAQVRSLLLQNDFSMVISDTALTAFPDYLNVRLLTDEVDNRSHITHLHGIFVRDDFSACTSEFFLHPRENPHEIGYEPSVRAIVDGYWRRAPIEIGTVSHETGHAFDKLFSKFIRTRISQTSTFKTAYKKDIAAMGGRQNAQDLGYEYFAREDEEHSRKETFAELCALEWGIGRSTDMAKDFSHCSAYVHDFNHSFAKAHDKGLTSLMLFMGSLIPNKKNVLDEGLCNKWTYILRTGSSVSPTDVQGWARHAPVSAIMRFAKLHEKNDPDSAQKNDQKIMDMLVFNVSQDKALAARLEKIVALPAFHEKLKGLAAEQPHPPSTPTAVIHPQTYHA